MDGVQDDHGGEDGENGDVGDGAIVDGGDLFPQLLAFLSCYKLSCHILSSGVFDAGAELDQETGG